MKELFDKMPCNFKHRDIDDCYWELYKAEVSGIKYYIRLFTESPCSEIKRFEGEVLKEVLIESLRWMKANTSRWR